MREDLGPGLYKFMKDCSIIEPTAEELEKFKDTRKTIQDLWENTATPKYEIFFSPENYELFQEAVIQMYKNESKE